MESDRSKQNHNDCNARKVTIQTACPIQCCIYRVEDHQVPRRADKRLGMQEVTQKQRLTKYV
jgi:hypothetical protein